MVEYSIAVVVRTDLYWVRTAASITWITSVPEILMVYFVTNLALSLLDHRYWLTEIKRFGSLTARFRFENPRMVSLTLAHAQTNDHVSQFGI